MTAAYMQLLIHTMNNSLFPNTDPAAMTWTGPPPEIVTVQSLLYASLATSLFAAFLAMFGKQWVNRYLRNQGGSAAEKSRDRQRKLDGFEKWHFYLTIESLPVMLQLALLLLGCALSRYLWTISRAVAGVIIAITLFGITSYAFFTLAGTLNYNCPYQTPLSSLTRTIIKYLIHRDATLPRSLRPLIAAIPSFKNLGQIPTRLRSGVRSALKNFGCIPAVVGEPVQIPLAAIVPSPTWIFDDVSIDWEVCKADARCISWVLYSTTDTDVVLSTVRFAADTPWYPEIAGVLPPRILADLFFDSLLDGRVIPGKSEHAISTGMALASVLSIHLSIAPGNHALQELCRRITHGVRFELVPSSEPMYNFVVTALALVGHNPSAPPPQRGPWFYEGIPEQLSTTCKLWLSRIILQTTWRWRRTRLSILNLTDMDSISKAFVTDGDQVPTILKTNCILTMAISLGLKVDIHDLYAPDDKCVLDPSFS